MEESGEVRIMNIEKESFWCTNTVTSRISLDRYLILDGMYKIWCVTFKKATKPGEQIQ